MGKKVTKSMITDFDKFKAAWEKDAGDPYDSIMYYLIAALNIEKDDDLADAMMTVVVSKKDSLEDGSSPSGLKLNTRGARYYIGQFAKNPNIAKSYVGGTNENDYRIDKGKLTLAVTRDQDTGEGKKKIFIDCGGADSPRPVSLAKNKHGQWKLIEYSSLCVGVKPPASSEGDF
ncbi:MAG: hypothetical protein RTU30_12505 [Candidatus Thorarchaeota archaeon]